MRDSLAVMVLLGALAVVVGEDEKPSKAQAALAEINKEILDWYREYGKTGRIKRLADMPPPPERYDRKLLEHAKQNPKDPSAAEALITLVSHHRNAPGTDGLPAQALALLRKSHIKSPTMTWRVVKMMAHTGGTLDELAQEVAATHPDKRTRALVYRALIFAGQQRIRQAEPLKQDPKKFEKKFGESLYDRYGGPEAAKKMLAEAQAAEAAIPKYRAKLEGELKGVLPDVSVGATASATQAVDLQGKKVRLSDLEGKVVVLHFWAASNPGIAATLRETRELVKEMQGRPFAFVSVSADKNKETVEKFLQKEPMPWTHWWIGPEARLLETWDVQAPLMIYVINHKGVIRQVWTLGDFQYRKFADVAKQLVKDAEAEGGGKKGKEK
jgi:peroxiredoxin